MADNTCIAVDACCDLPDDFIKKHQIRILPIYLRFEDETFTDDRDPGRTMEFYQQGWLARSYKAESVPVSAEEMSSILEKELVPAFDKVLAITIMESRSKVYENVRDAVWVSQPKFKDLRGALGLDRRFRIQVLDSNNMFTGQAVLTYEAARLLHEEEASIERVAMELDALKKLVRCMIVPQDLFHLKNRAGNRGEKSDKSVNWLSYQIGSVLNIKPIVMAYQGETGLVDKAMGFAGGLDKVFGKAVAAIDKGLSIKVICMSYAGDLAEIQKESGYQKFVDYAKSKGVPTLLSVMSTTAAINVGPGCFSIAFAEAG